MTMNTMSITDAHHPHIRYICKIIQDNISILICLSLPRNKSLPCFHTVYRNRTQIFHMFPLNLFGCIFSKYCTWLNWWSFSWIMILSFRIIMILWLCMQYIIWIILILLSNGRQILLGRRFIRQKMLSYILSYLGIIIIVCVLIQLCWKTWSLFRVIERWIVRRRWWCLFTPILISFGEGIKRLLKGDILFPQIYWVSWVNYYLTSIRRLSGVRWITLISVLLSWNDFGHSRWTTWTIGLFSVS